MDKPAKITIPAPKVRRRTPIPPVRREVPRTKRRPKHKHQESE